jgi:hypothetical protein
MRSWRPVGQVAEDIGPVPEKLIRHDRGRNRRPFARPVSGG